jgi:hypothetical protein
VSRKKKRRGPSDQIQAGAPAGPADAADESAEPSPLDGWLRPALIVGGACLLVCAGFALLDARLFFRAYLVAFMLALGAALGCLALLMIGRLTGGRWNAQLRPVLEAAVQTLPLLAGLFVPLLLGLRFVYPWAADPNLFSANPALANKGVWLSVPFFAGRAVLYFLIWGGLGWLLVRGLRRLGPNATSDEMRPLRAVSAVGLGLYGLSMTFAAIDWTMSLEPEWFSTIYGVMLATGQMLTGLAFAVVLTLLPILLDRDEERPPTGILDDLGNLLLAFTMLWAYMGFSQLLLIYAGNLPEETVWYLHRMQGPWEWPGLAILLFQFGTPFLLLLRPDVKRNPRALFGVALLILFMRSIDLTWVVAPSFGFGPLARDDPHAWLLALTLPLAVAGVGGLWLAFFLWRLRLAPPPVLPSAPTEEAPAHA